VQQGGLDRGGVELPVGQQFRDSNRVGDIRLAALAELAQVGRIGNLERFLDALDLADGR
jgi:hypothetical protein